MGPEVMWGPAPGMFWIFPLLCFAFMVVTAIVLFMVFCRGGGRMTMRHGREPGSGPNRETPRQIIDRRYAGGEIDKVQYEQMKRDIEPDRTQA